MVDFIQTDSDGRNLIKGGVKIAYTQMTAFTKDGFLVPFGHPEGIVVAGAIATYEGVDNTNGQDGDVSAAAYNFMQGGLNIFASDLTEEFKVKIENFYQPVYASSLKTLYTMPGTGRLPLGILTAIKKNHNIDPSRDPNEIVYEIDTSKITPLYR
ncbi:hypothetical protein N5853_06135 [Bartonella sp. HY329]|uniref:hypothetical protein n=1 Tax=unclassified Bartonella TaxID=2645622 RepID=UPI0021C654D9|nr:MULTISPECIES: hypothetical protein [unclassified Bartonella]UXM96186.1 hypothetical protein N5853_06135 [Bartonella sp. HY329]UXN10510.1 hypothetical protein N5852_06140 [Bartonella sp. HY328]